MSARGRPWVWPFRLSRAIYGTRPESLEFTMKSTLQLGRRATVVVVTAAAICFATLLMKSGSGQPAHTNPPQGSGSASNAPPSEATVDLSPGQLKATNIEPG